MGYVVYLFAQKDRKLLVTKFSFRKRNTSKKNHTNRFRMLFAICILGFFTDSFNLLSAQSKQALRYEIDAKRGGVTYTSKDALPRGREFKRLDSTYYVGWMLEGAYKFDHAADYLGFKAASTQLQRALTLLEKDFKTALKTRTNDVMTYIGIMRYHRDWDFTAYTLMQCYSNMDEPANVWKLLQKCKQIDLQDELYSDTYNYLAWTVHRNRFYTSAKYPFLKNSIDENEQYANKLTDSAAVKIKRDATLNKTFFGPNYELEKMPSVWHYKSILYTYQLNIESGAYYYDKLKQTKYFPANNYATFCSIQAKFKEAENFYNISKSENPGDKRLNESLYYLSVINQYKGECKKGIDELKQVIKANGSTPGFGWYNIALARELLYDGQTDIAKRYALRAEQFKEIHIGTTLGQSHYDFTTSLINLIIKQREIESVKFLNKNWWYTPSDLTRIAQLTVEKYGLQFLIINQFAENPERDRVIYKLFSTESTVSFDEISQLLEGFSTNYFLERFQKEIGRDMRPNVKRYYAFFVARMLMKKGAYQEAAGYLEKILADTSIDKNYEKLLLARTYESFAVCNEERKESSSVQITSSYDLYPQLVPFSGLKIPMRLHSNESNTDHNNIISILKRANIDWTNNLQNSVPDVYINFTTKSQMPIIEYHVTFKGKNIVPPQAFSYKNSTAAGRELCFAIFNIGNDDRTITVEKQVKK